MGDIIIGKHTLESLTSGMYSDPYVVFREYIQNATDSIDAAYKVRILKHGIDRITISLNPAERQIVIEDNGLGVESENAEMVKKIGGIKYRTIGTPGAESWVDADACERPAWCDRKEGMKHEITENEEINKSVVMDGLFPVAIIREEELDNWILDVFNDLSTAVQGNAARQMRFGAEEEK